MATTSPNGQTPGLAESKNLKTSAPRLVPKSGPWTETPGPDFEPLLDSDEAAALLKIHPKTLQRMARNREIAGVQVGKLWRFRASALNEWLAEKMAG